MKALSLFILIILGAFVATLYGVMRFRKILTERKYERERALAKLIKSRNNLTLGFSGIPSLPSTTNRFKVEEGGVRLELSIPWERIKRVVIRCASKAGGGVIFMDIFFDFRSEPVRVPSTISPECRIPANFRSLVELILSKTEAETDESTLRFLKDGTLPEEILSEEDLKKVQPAT